ncbi:hypothetical protein DC20_16915 [Rufibacter tibetensis]|uniref:Uncharacterized protein n=1 Tax=Rufibacter tibetensis TaxID=512763 RepID=A0A0N7HWW0_9BACT|nr:hypothetical protein DC20_16915 [Rufibacter tibetensis]
MLLLPPFGLKAQEAPSKVRTSAVKVTSTAQPLYFLKTGSANVPLNFADIQSLDKEWIKSISVLKDKNAIEQFGQTAKHGVVLIELKAEQEQAFLKTIKEQNANSSSGIKPVHIRLYCAAPTSLGEPLYIIQTKSGEVVVSKEDLSGINPEWIKSIEVLKDGEIIKRYKDQGKYGVILITFASEREQEVLQIIKDNN